MEQTDDCHASLALCSSTSTTDGWTWECMDGYSGDGKTCEDIDECADGTHECKANADCKNTVGSHECTCQAYFHQDTFDNCTPYHVCEMPSKGGCSHMCTKDGVKDTGICSCYSGDYELLADGKTCAKKIRWAGIHDAKCARHLKGCVTKDPEQMKCYDHTAMDWENDSKCDATKPDVAVCSKADACPALTDDSGDAKYKGCFADYNNRIFNHVTTKTDGTVFDKATCQTECIGFAHYGIQFNGKECFCGLPSELFDTQGPSLGCGLKKGGSWSMDVYAVDASLGEMTYTSSAFDDNLIGCYHDRATTPKRILSYLHSTTGESMEDCEKACVAQNHGYFGMENNVECWCGLVDIDDYHKYGKSTNCAKNGQGGPWAMMVYKTGNQMICDAKDCDTICTVTNGPPAAAVCSCNTYYALNGDGKTCDYVDPCASHSCSHICTDLKNGNIECACPGGKKLSVDKKTCIDDDGTRR